MIENIIFGVFLGLIGLFGTAITIQLKKIVPYIERKFGIDVSDKNEALINSYIESAISYAEEFAMAKTKSFTGNTVSKISSNEKLNAAIGYVKTVAPIDTKNITEEQIGLMIESKLAKIVGVGATGNRAF